MTPTSASSPPPRGGPAGPRAASRPGRSPSGGDGRTGDLRHLLPAILARQSELAARRRRRILVVGLGCSVLLHLILVAWLAFNLRAGWGEDRSAIGITVSAASDSDTSLTDVATGEDAAPTASDLADASPTATDLEAVAPAGVEIAAAASSAPSLGGSGGAASTAGGGSGGSGTSFFGIRSSGSRFAYIVDRSGSMRGGGRMDYARDELVRSIEGLPEHALFHVVLFSTTHVAPPNQEQWLPARSRAIRRVRSWLGREEPGGGTEPGSAFESVFALPQRPDVIFFLTDGEIPESTVELVRELNARGRSVVINTVAFGDPASQDALQEIARISGGRYTFFAAPGLP